MAIKKTELYSSLWASCNELRGGMDVSQYKDYVLTFLFLKYVSDKYLNDPRAMIVVPDGCTFPDMVKLKGDKKVGEKLNIVLDGIAKENELPWLANNGNDFNNKDRLGKGKQMVDRLSNLIAIFEKLELNFTKDSPSAGAIYEDLACIFSNESGMRSIVPYTPPEVSKLMAKVLGISKAQTSDATVYDPTCGDGSLLLQVAKEANYDMTLYGQEINSTVCGHAQINMILHDAVTAEIAKGNVLSEPKFLDDGDLQRFDYAVAAPPFSLKNWSAGFDPEGDQFSRFSFGIPPKQQGDFAFIQHMIASLKSEGRMAVLISHGALFRGNAEAVIRQSILEADLVEAVIGLPPNLLTDTGIPICILVCNKQKPKDRANKVLFINADRGFNKTGRKNILPPEQVEKIADTFETYSDVERFSRVVSLDEIRGNSFNLNIPRYVDSSELAALLKQHCGQFDKYLIKDLALEINSVGAGKKFEDKTNALFIPRMSRLAPTADMNTITRRHHDYFQVVLNDKAINDYVAQFFCSTIGQLALSALTTGSAFPRIDRASLDEVIIALPTLEHQKANIDTHRKLSTLRESIEKINQDLSLNPTSSSEFEAQLDAMLEAVGNLSMADQIRSIIRQGESKTVEFKETYNFCLHQKKNEKYVETAALKTIVAFLNSCLLYNTDAADDRSSRESGGGRPLKKNKANHILARE